jgi:WD40 repeat protein
LFPMDMEDIHISIIIMISVMGDLSLSLSWYQLWVDVVHLAWSPNGQYLASCGLDTSVIIWGSGRFGMQEFTFRWRSSDNLISSIEVLQKLDAHHGFVKGLTWDPAGKYLASQVIRAYILCNGQPCLHTIIVGWSFRYRLEYGELVGGETDFRTIRKIIRSSILQATQVNNRCRLDYLAYSCV